MMWMESKDGFKICLLVFFGQAKCPGGKEFFFSRDLCIDWRLPAD